MLRQAALAAQVVYQSSFTENCSDGCASRRPPRRRQRDLFARLSAGVSVSRAISSCTLPPPGPPDYSGQATSARQFRPGNTVPKGGYFLPVCAWQSPCFSQNRGFVKGAQPLYDISGGLSDVGFSAVRPKTEESEKPPENQPVTRQIAGTDAQTPQHSC